MTDHICNNCAFAQFPNGHCKIKVGICWKNAGNDILPLNVMRSSMACEHWVKKKKKKSTPRWWNRKRNTSR